MRRTSSTRRHLLLATIPALALLLATGVAADESTEADRLFAIHVQPLIAARCLPCHGDNPNDLKGGLDLRIRDAMLDGEDTSDAVLVPGDAERSLLYTAVAGLDDFVAMPPKATDRLATDQAWQIRDWINSGAPWPDAATVSRLVEEHQQQQADLVAVPTSGGLSDDWTSRRYRIEDLWAYLPLSRPEVPVESLAELPGHTPIDAFVNRRLAVLGLEPAPPADRRTLIRRVTFDLTGLPPTPEEVDHFVDDPSPDDAAFARVIDRLLAGPHYGERWGRHWLDVVRYADTAGLANDYERPNAWRYRDYVIRSLDQDKPYDRFVREQIAGVKWTPWSRPLGLRAWKPPRRILHRRGVLDPVLTDEPGNRTVAGRVNPS